MGLYVPCAPTIGVSANNQDTQELERQLKALQATVEKQTPTASPTTNGYIKLPPDSNGVTIIIQWGLTNNIPQDSYLTITLPIPFPNACLNVTATTSTWAKSNYLNGVCVDSMAKNAFTLKQCGGASAFYWQAIGY